MKIFRAQRRRGAEGSIPRRRPYSINGVALGWSTGNRKAASPQAQPLCASARVQTFFEFRQATPSTALRGALAGIPLTQLAREVEVA